MSTGWRRSVGATVAPSWSGGTAELVGLDLATGAVVSRAPYDEVALSGLERAAP